MPRWVVFLHILLLSLTQCMRTSQTKVCPLNKNIHIQSCEEELVKLTIHMVTVSNWLTNTVCRYLNLRKICFRSLVQDRVQYRNSYVDVLNIYVAPMLATSSASQIY